MTKYSIIAVVTMDNGEIYVSKRFDHIGDDTNNIIHGRMLNLSYEELNKDYEDSNLIIFSYEIKEFVEDYFMQKLNLTSNPDMELFKYIFVNNETDEYSHYIAMQTNIKNIDYDITVHKIDNADVIKKCIEMVENKKDVSISIENQTGKYHLKMSIEEIIDTSEYYCFKQDLNNELKIKKTEIGIVTFDNKEDTEKFHWICSNDTIIEIK